MLMYTKEELQEIFRIVYNKSKKRFITKVDLCNYLSTNEKYLRENIQSTGAYEDCDDVFLNIKKTIKVFDNIDEEAAYWLGYLMADGCFTTTSRGTAFRLMLECKIEDKEILSARRWHTTGKENMSKLDKIIYLADMIEPSRDFSGVEELRNVSKDDLDKAMLNALTHTIKYLLEKGCLIDINTMKARNYLVYNNYK